MPPTLSLGRPLSFRHLLICLLFIVSPVSSHAWDETGHRLSAYSAWELFSSQERQALFAILQQHPRYQEDFVDVMPVNVMVGSDMDKARWMLSQAAVWPDIARGFDQENQIRYHRPDWHWIDGAWIRGDGIDGNVYVGADSKPAIRGSLPGQVSDERDVDNVLVALEYNLQLLSAPNTAAAQKAVALCWVLHLAGDIHQPLHTGALISRGLFPNGDRGGNGITAIAGNLHSIWDGALRSQPFDATLQHLISSAMQADISSMSTDPYLWLEESREIMQQSVYPDAIKAGVLRSERLDIPLPEFSLSDSYFSSMRSIAEQRLALAGLRIALILRAPLSANDG